MKFLILFLIVIAIALTCAYFYILGHRKGYNDGIKDSELAMNKHNISDDINKSYLEGYNKGLETGKMLNIKPKEETKKKI